MTVVMEGFHGTDNAISDNIIKTGLYPSIGDKEWLGDGAYFFINGMSKKPEYQAEKWAISQSWDKINKRKSYSEYAVLSSIIEIEEDFFLDLTTSEGAELLEYIQDKCLKKLKELKKANHIEYIDGLLINMARNEKILPIKVSKGNFFIKFKKERIHKISRRSPNCTICAVYDPVRNIKLIKTGRI